MSPPAFIIAQRCSDPFPRNAEPGDAIVPCIQCSVDCWVSPLSQRLIEAGAQVRCLNCNYELQFPKRASMIDGGGNVGH